MAQLYFAMSSRYEVRDLNRNQLQVSHIRSAGTDYSFTFLLRQKLKPA